MKTRELHCACGALAEPDQICKECGRKNLICPACDGDISLMAQTLLLECPYCSTVLNKIEDDAPPYYPINFSITELQERLLDFLLNRFGIPDDFSRKFRVLSSRISFVPIRLFDIQAWLNKEIVEVDTKGVVLTNDLWYREHLNRYRFAVRVSQVMDISSMHIHNYKITLSAKDAENVAVKYAGKLLEQDKKRFSEVYSSPNISCKFTNEVYYPFYEVFFTYSGTRYRSIVDAANGAVCYSEHPVCMHSRAMVMGAAGLLLGLTLLVAFVLMIIGGAPSILAAFFMSVVGFVASARIFWMGVRSYGGQESHAVDSTTLDVTNFTKKMKGLEREDLSSMKESAEE